MIFSFISEKKYLLSLKSQKENKMTTLQDIVFVLLVAVYDIRLQVKSTCPPLTLTYLCTELG